MDNFSTQMQTSETAPLIPTVSASHEDIECGSTTTAGHSNDSPPRKAGYGLFVGICFSLNYSIGSGILGLPFEYFKSGFIMGSVLLCYLGLLTYITYTHVMDGMQRGEALTILANQNGITRTELMYDPSYTADRLKGTPPQQLKNKYSFIRNEYQLSELIGMFAGKWWKLLYDVSYVLATLIALWSYSALFGISLARNVGIPGIASACDMNEDGDDPNTGCRGLYSFYVAIFWLWTCIVSLMDFSEQQGIQIAATVARVVIISLMMLTSIGLIYSSWYYDGSRYRFNELTEGNYAEGVSPWKWSGMAYMIAVCSFAYGNQYCVTDIIEPMSLNDRAHKQHSLWAYSVGICCAVYVFSGITISLFFGGHTESPCTLAWRGFMGFDDTNEQPVWAAIVSWFIVLFPAIDIASAYPLNVVTMANTIEAAVIPQHLQEDVEDDDLQNANDHDDDDVEEREEPQNNSLFQYENRYNILFRLLICTLTAILALIEWNFDLILAISGAFGLLGVYGGPTILGWKSKEMMQTITNGVDPNAHKTPTTREWTAHNAWYYVIFGTIVVAFVAVFVDIAEGYS